MTKTLIRREDPISLDDLVKGLGESDEPIEIVDGNTTVAVILSPGEYKELRRIRAWKLIDEWRDRNADKDPDEVYAEITEIVEGVRQEAYERQLRKSGGT